MRLTPFLGSLQIFESLLDGEYCVESVVQLSSILYEPRTMDHDVLHVLGHNAAFKIVG